jgi:hypothetical protein
MQKLGVAKMVSERMLEQKLLRSAVLQLVLVPAQFYELLQLR